MILSHYSDSPDPIIMRRPSPEDQNQTPFFKPCGLWVSVDGKDDWLSWCKGEHFRLGRLAYRHIVKLKPDANVLLVDTNIKLRDLADDMKRDRPLIPGSCSTLYTNWDAVTKLYGGLIIAPYQWEYRLGDHGCDWYYSWDCASGCLWDPSVVESITLDPNWKFEMTHADQSAA